ncbi:OLC1v1005729C1 [Oldenlandia corymbosa var. corymbosa]|uniref:OLC1v1005729C1 n=1 Tax=Oldenlandia corymbosa var. corymbosa TaxID=529605 RepID=A0AAV1DHM8_OLDCO|nr:OLC1v1005729C1 [Oldenlandia corymbosa var. corymbosa]
MEKLLCDAAIENNVTAFRQFLREDPLVLDKAMINCQDMMNPLHTAALFGNAEFVKEVLGSIKYLIENNVLQVNVKSANGSTPLDLIQGESDSEIAQVLERAGAEGSTYDLISSRRTKTLYKKRDVLMVVASLIATMAFQATLNPAGGVWQDNKPDGSDKHVAGEAVMAQKYPNTYRNFITTNTIAFVSSLSIILLLISGLPFKKRLFLWVLMVIMWLTITAIALTYNTSIYILTPKDDIKKLNLVTWTAIIVWCGVISLLFLGNTLRLINRWLKRRHGIDLFKMLKRQGNSGTQVQSLENPGTILVC